MFPFILNANDYHEFDYFVDILRQLIGCEIKYKEIDFLDNPYQAVFYIDNCPTNYTNIRIINC